MRYRYTIVDISAMDPEELLASPDWVDNEFAIERVVPRLPRLTGQERADA